MFNRKHALAVASAALVACGLAACRESSQGTADVTPASSIPQTLFVSNIADAPVAVAAAKASAKEGDTVVLHGHIGGSKDPFTTGRAVFTVVDTKLAPCTDNCGTPWDFCCDTQADIAANAAMVQVVGADGAVVKSDIKGVQGVKPGAEVVIAGKVAKRDNESTLVVNATSIWVKGG
jgi:alpha-D-ribose 1-methylphosphonate 5-triphosphate synthase subunit PhnG